MLAYTQLVPLTPLPAAEMVSRAQWIEANVRSMRPVLDRVGARVGRRHGPARPARAGADARPALGAGRRPDRLSRPARPRPVRHAAARLDRRRRACCWSARTSAPRRSGWRRTRGELLHWVTLHEITHAVQFGSVPWLRLHLAALVREVVDTLEVKIDTSQGAAPARAASDLREIVDSRAPRRARDARDRARAPRARRPHPGDDGGDRGPRGARHGRGRRGGDPVAGDQLREALERRREERSGPMRLLERVLGFELKLRQYRDGKRFCDAVVRARRDRGPQPRLERAARPADARRAGRSGRLARANGCSVCHKVARRFSLSVQRFGRLRAAQM